MSASLATWSSRAPGQAEQPVGFDPDRQIPISLVTADFRAQVRAFPETATGQTRSIRLTTRDGVSEILLPFQFRQVNGIARGPFGKLVVVGMSAGAVYDIGIIDLAAHRTTDQFWCYNPSVSVDGQYIAFTKFFGPHSSPSPEDHSMLYVVARTARENRPVGIELDDIVDVGFALYPFRIGNWKADNISVPAETAHSVAGRYSWEDPNQYFFADFVDREVSIVRVAISDGKADVYRQTVTSSQLKGEFNKYFPPRLSDVIAEGGNLKLTFSSNVTQSIVISLADFVNVGSVNLKEQPLGRR